MTLRVLVSTPYMLPVPEEFRVRLEAERIEIVRAQASQSLTEEQLLPLVKTIDGAICGDDQFTEAVLRAAPRLKVISKWGTGIDSIDIRAAAQLGIRVCNTPDAVTDAVADTTLGYILSFARRLPWMDDDVRRGLWTKPDGVSLRECTLGVVGVGNIGKAVVHRARAFGMTLLGTDPMPVAASFLEATGLRLTSLLSLLEGSDFVSLHCDLNASSFHLMGRGELAVMRPRSILINTSRGAVIDEPALAETLREHRIAGAALDVFEIEPLPAESPLRELDNCLLAPHNANSSLAAHRRVHQSTIDNLLNGLRQAV